MQNEPYIMLLGVGGLKMRSLHNETFLHYNGVIAVVTNTMGSLKENHLRTVIKLQILFFKARILQTLQTVTNPHLTLPTD